MTISFYLIISIVLILSLLLVKFIGENNRINHPRSRIKWIFYAFLCILGLLSMLTVRKYMYPKDEEIFGNTDYHLLEHRGFVSDSTIILVDNQSNSSLWDTKTGGIKLDAGSVTLENYHEPFFSADRSDRSRFVLRNPLYDTDVSKQLLLEYNGDVILNMNIEPYKDEDGIQRCRYSVVDNANDTAYVSSFDKIIRKGYPLSDILAATPGYLYTVELDQILDGSLLVRESIDIDIWRVGSEKSVPDIEGIALKVMPGLAWYEGYSSIIVNGCSLNYEANACRTIPYQEQMLFYSGVGRSKTDVCSIQSKEGKLELRYAVSKKHYFSKDRERVFIASSVDAVLQSQEDGGYYYNLFDNEDNAYHVNAQMRYTQGSSREEMAFQVMDMYSEDPSAKSNHSAGDEFTLTTVSSDSMKWILGVRDLRAENSLGWNYIMGILLVFLFFVLVRIAADHFFETHTLSYLEFAVYVVLICLSTIRLIISWRVSTFVPVEDITGPVLLKMMNGTGGWTGFVAVYPAALALITILRGLWQKKHEDDPYAEDDEGQRGRFMAFIEDIRPWKIPLLFIVLLILCAVGGAMVSMLDRLLNIPIPLILYMLFDLWIVVKEDAKDTDHWALRLINSFIITGYLFLADAGFIIIFIVYLAILHCIIGPLTDGVASIRRKTPAKYLISIASVLLLFVLLRFEGNVMIWAFDSISYFAYIIWAGFLAFIVWFAYYLFKRFGHKVLSMPKAWQKYVVIVLSFILCAAALFLSYKGVCEVLPEKIAGKDHMKWRAEVQRLGENENIDKLMQECEFNSSDITFIMRSAHNQWFINQYFNEGKTHDRYLELQPHSDQGCTYTTQTTDLAITRYVISEHGYWPPRFMLILFLLLILIYCFEVRFGDRDGKQDRIFLGALVMLFTLPLMVYLSATNRIVFVGQDFPFMSVQSKVAVVFPVLLMLLATLPVFKDRMENERGRDDIRLTVQKRWIPAFLLLFYVLTVVAIKPLGQNQKDTQFNVSEILQDISSKVALIDRDIVRCQYDADMEGKSKDEVWAYFKESSKSQNYMKFQQDTSDVFFQSLLTYFDQEQLDKDDPDELLHMRKRNGIWHLNVNMRHYFIPSKKKAAEPWEGDVLAARVHREYTLSDMEGRKDCILDSDESVQKNLMPKQVRRNLPGMSLMKFDGSWTPEGEPLVLISSSQGRASKQFFQIESEQGTILAKSDGATPGNQVATRIQKGDIIVLNSQKNKGESKVVTWNYGMESDRYFAKNIWLNGKRRLFYPMGEDFIWSYQFANMVSSLYGVNDTLRKEDIRLSLDYDLHEKMQEEMDKINKPKIRGLVSREVESLRRFAELGASDMKSRSNRTGFYYKDGELKSLNSNVSPAMQRALQRINASIAIRIAADSDMEGNPIMVADAIYDVTGCGYQFSAVAINGDGKIRLMFDHGKSRKVDPNNVSHFNRYISELYRAGENSSERDLFGSRALQILPSGPGSSFKPIAYTSITSRQQMDWESIDLVIGEEKAAAQHVVTPEDIARNPSSANNVSYDWYGGLEMEEIGERPLSIDGSSGLLHNNYLTYSNNLYHSVMIMLGLQKKGYLENIMMPATTGAKAFPIFTYRGQRMSFNPEVWFKDEMLDTEHGVLNEGLSENFRLYQGMTGLSKAAPVYSNAFGSKGAFGHLYEKSGNYRNWVYPESGSMNVIDRQQPPVVRNGFNQMLLGASPLEVSPMDMATMAMRLATLNAAPDITTLSDEDSIKPDYEFFSMDPSWGSEQEYFRFYQRQVLKQLREVPKIGTASALNRVVGKYDGKYYIYAKTGTLNDGRAGQSASSRMKHLMVIISDTELENPSLTVSDLKDVKYYVLYLSYIGISNFTTTFVHYEPLISAVMNSELFKQYMDE